MSISNIGIDPGVTDQGLVGYQVDTLSLSNTVAAALTRTGVISAPGFITAGTQAGVPPTMSPPVAIGAVDITSPATITVTDQTGGNSGKVLVQNTDYTLTPSGSGSQLTYSILRISTSANSANNDSITVAYLFGTVPDTEAAIGETVAQAALAITTVNQQYSTGTYPGSTYGAADTTGTSVASVGPALPGGSVADVIPWAGSGQAGGQTGPVNISDYSAYQGTLFPQREGLYGWPRGVPDTEEVYGGSTAWWAAGFAPTLQNYVSGDIGITADPQIMDTTIGGGSLYTENVAAASGPAYRNPILGVAGRVQDTSLTDILGNQIAAATLTNAAYAGSDVDTNPWGQNFPAGGPPGGWTFSPSQPVALSTQTDTFASAQASTPVYLSQGGVVTASIVATNTSTSTTMVLNTDYTLVIAGNGPDTFVQVTFIVAAHFANGNNVSIAYNYGTPQYYDSVVPAQVPLSPAVGATSAGSQVIASFVAGGTTLTQTGITTPPAGLVIVDNTAGRVGNVGVLNVDYVVTAVVGSGSTLTYTVAFKAGSTQFVSGDNVTVSYFFGNAAYFASGPALPTNRGAQVSWGAPAGTTEVDYYLIQSLPDLGTQFVPKTGLPGFYGEPNVAGSDDYGQPVFQSDTFTAFPATSVAAPAAPGTSTATTGGTIAAGTYQIVVTYVNAVGESVGSVASAQVTTGAASTITVTSPAASGTATSWNAYFSQVGGAATATTRQNSVPVNLGTNFTLTTPPTSTGAAPPTLNTTVITITKQGVVTPPGQLIVRDTSSSTLTIQGAAASDYQNLTPTGGTIAGPAAQDPLQPLGQVLIFNVDYTVTTINNGPWTLYQIQRAPSSVNAFAGDTIVVDYYYSQTNITPLTAANDTIVLSAGSGALLHTGVFTAPQNLIVFDTTTGRALAFGLDFTLALTGIGPTRTFTITVITTGPAGSGLTDTVHAYYLYGAPLASFFQQGLLENTPIIYRPNGTTYAFQGYQFQVAAGNRAGLGPFSNVSDFVVPLNYQAPQPGFQGTTQTITFRDPANTINPIYLPSGAVLSGTGLGY